MDPSEFNKEDTGIILIFEGCTFDLKSGTDIFNSVSNNSVDQAANGIYIKAKSLDIQSVLPWFNTKTKSDIDREQGTLQNTSRFDKLKRKSMSMLENAANKLVNSQFRKAQTMATNLIRNNIPSSVVGSLAELERGNLINAAYQLFNKPRLGRSYDSREISDDTSIKNLGKAYYEFFQPRTKIENLGNEFNVEQFKPNLNINNLGKGFTSPISISNTEINNLGSANEKSELKQSTKINIIGNEFDNQQFIPSVYNNNLGNEFEAQQFIPDTKNNDLGNEFNVEPFKPNLSINNLGNEFQIQSQELKNTLKPNDLGNEFNSKFEIKKDIINLGNEFDK